MEQQQEKDLLKRLQKGDAKAFEILYNFYWEALYRKAYKRVNSSGISEELIQQLFIDLWEKREVINVKSSLEAFLHGMLKKKILLYFRNQYLHETHMEIIKGSNKAYDNSLGQSIEQRDLLEKVSYLSDCLPNRSRKVFELSRKQWLSNDEIAEKLQISNKAVEYHINYALRYLRSHLKVHMTFLTSVTFQELLHWLNNNS